MDGGKEGALDTIPGTRGLRRTEEDTRAEARECGARNGMQGTRGSEGGRSSQGRRRSSQELTSPVDSAVSPWMMLDFSYYLSCPVGLCVMPI